MRAFYIVVLASFLCISVHGGDVSEAVKAEADAASKLFDARQEALMRVTALIPESTRQGSDLNLEYNRVVVDAGSKSPQLLKDPEASPKMMLQAVMNLHDRLASVAPRAGFEGRYNARMAELERYERLIRDDIRKAADSANLKDIADSLRGLRK